MFRRVPELSGSGFVWLGEIWGSEVCSAEQRFRQKAQKRVGSVFQFCGYVCMCVVVCKYATSRQVSTYARPSALFEEHTRSVNHI